MRRISGIFCTRRSAGFYWTGGTACSLEGVEVKGWMRGGWARGPIAKTGALRGCHLFAVSRMEHFSTPLYISRAYRGYLSPKKEINKFFLENIHETERSKLISVDHHFLRKNESIHSNSRDSI